MKKFTKAERRIEYVVYNNPTPEQTDLVRIRELLEQVGMNIKLARLRRRIRTRNVCQRVGISRTTLWSVEKGSPAVGIGIYAQILYILGLEQEITKWGENDVVGKKIQDEELRLKDFRAWHKRKVSAARIVP